jgi:hypothetical protein
MPSGRFQSTVTTTPSRADDEPMNMKLSDPQDRIDWQGLLRGPQSDGELRHQSLCPLTYQEPCGPFHGHALREACLLPVLLKVVYSSRAYDETMQMKLSIPLDRMAHAGSLARSLSCWELRHKKICFFALDLRGAGFVVFHSAGQAGRAACLESFVH